MKQIERISYMEQLFDFISTTMQKPSINHEQYEETQKAIAVLSDYYGAFDTGRITERCSPVYPHLFFYFPEIIRKKIRKLSYHLRNAVKSLPAVSKRGKIVNCKCMFKIE